MALCGNCGSHSTRVRSRWTEKGVRLPDECNECAPEPAEKLTAPSDKKIWMGFEANPNQYEKRYDQDGVFYIRKPEYRAEQEQKLMQPCEDDAIAQMNAETEKRATRRTEPMSEAERAAAIAKAAEIAQALNASAQQAQKEREQAELDSWVKKAAQA